jgi:tetratricopeptide (TPR) repeat protein
LYQLYIKGRYHWNSGTLEGFHKAIDYYNQAIRKDPTYALAYAGLAEAYGFLPTDVNLVPSVAMPKAMDAARKAQELDETLAEPHAVLAAVNVWYKYDWMKATNRRSKNLPECSRNGS